VASPRRTGADARDVGHHGRLRQLVVDGIFGQKTRDAVIRFQTDHHLSADGIAGQTTWHWLWFGA
jgi:peptidoglycan hydrolase-like protein with peptidoglycan-binding domain